ncbi:hypothetical protein [Massilia polaris]|uniref:hypothetical protein n=1 Tax=Massilia polaris TaxID=2728846 RepID=UPI001E4FFB15|nr:hypothetical protein [Massilia polaris]
MITSAFQAAIRCNNCGAEVSAFRFAHGYVIVLDAENQVSLTVNQQVADRLAGKASAMSALPEFAAQHWILSLARADMPGVAAHMRPFLGNIPPRATCPIRTTAPISASTRSARRTATA